MKGQEEAIDQERNQQLMNKEERDRHKQMNMSLDHSRQSQGSSERSTTARASIGTTESCRKSMDSMEAPRSRLLVFLGYETTAMCFVKFWLRSMGRRALVRDRTGRALMETLWMWSLRSKEIVICSRLG